MSVPPAPHSCASHRLMEAPHVAVIGLGLIGASFAAALKRSDAVGRITGFDNNASYGSYCLNQLWIDQQSASLVEAVANADIVVLATPLSALASITKTIAPHLQPGTIVTDVCSVKVAAIDAITPHLPEDCILVPAHPIAGRALTGATAATEDLFEQKLCIITSETHTPPHAIAAVARLWEAVGCKAERMLAPNHDIVYGFVSHLPQIMAYAACYAIKDANLPTEQPETFSKFIRLGASNPALWAEIATANAIPLGHGLSHVLATLGHMIEEFATGERHGIASTSSPQAAVQFFPMLSAASLISVLSQFEKQNSVQLMPYAGTGLKDFASPATFNPKDALEAISNAYAQTAEYLELFRNRLQQIHTALATPTAQNHSALLELFTECQIAYQKLAGTSSTAH